MMKGLGDMSPDGRRDGRTQRRLYAPPKFFGEHKNVYIGASVYDASGPIYWGHCL